MATALFISPAQIKQRTNIDENVDEKAINIAIRVCQEEYTRNILGSALYDEIKGQIENNTLTALNTTLLNTYLQPSLMWHVVSEIQQDLYVKLTNKSVMIKGSDNSQPVSLDIVYDRVNAFKNRAERYDKRAILYLKENESSYPLYLNPGNGIDTITPKGNTYTTGWYLGGTTAYDFPTSQNDCCDE